MPKDAELVLENGTFTLPVIEGTEGERAIDIRKLREQTGLVVLDSATLPAAKVRSPT